MYDLGDTKIVDSRSKGKEKVSSWEEGNVKENFPCIHLVPVAPEQEIKPL